MSSIWLLRQDLLYYLVFCYQFQISVPCLAFRLLLFSRWSIEPVSSVCIFGGKSGWVATFMADFFWCWSSVIFWDELLRAPSELRRFASAVVSDCFEVWRWRDDFPEWCSYQSARTQRQWWPHDLRNTDAWN